MFKQGGSPQTPRDSVILFSFEGGGSGPQKDDGRSGYLGGRGKGGGLAPRDGIFDGFRKGGGLSPYDGHFVEFGKGGGVTGGFRFTYTEAGFNVYFPSSVRIIF